MQQQGSNTDKRLWIARRFTIASKAAKETPYVKPDRLGGFDTCDLCQQETVENNSTRASIAVRLCDVCSVRKESYGDEPSKSRKNKIKIKAAEKLKCPQ